MLATLTPQLSTATGEREGLSGLPRVDRPAYCLSFNRYAHGEMKLSIYPQPVPKSQHAHTCSETSWQTAVKLSAADAEHMRLSKKVSADTLVQRSELQDDREEIAGFGGLPPRKMFRAYGRTVLRETGWYAWTKFGKSGLALTLTIPGTGDLIAETVARWSGWLLNDLKQWWRDLFDEDYCDFAVWEPQDRGMLHLHVCLCARERDKLEQVRKGWKERVNNLLIRLSKDTRVDLFRKNKYWSWQENLSATRQDAQWLRQNPARYMTKYLTKSGRNECDIATFHPSRWWSVNRAAAAEARAERVRIVLGGLSVPEAVQVVGDWFTSMGAPVGKVFESVFFFGNPKFQECGGMVLYAESEASADLARWWIQWVDAFCSG